jgi:prophage regulatory protein
MKTIRINDLATVNGKAGKLPVSPATIWRWVKNGSFPKPFKLGTHVTVWDVAAVNKFLADRADAGGK